MPLPTPTADAQAHSDALCARIRSEVAANDGWISFARYMELALYAPGLGYYAGGARKFGASGDFVTAPELTPLFAAALAAQAEQIMALSAPHIIEAGAGSGQLAVDLLLALEARQALPQSYAILELSGELRARQQAKLAQQAPHLLPRLSWLERLPTQFSGLVIGNEVLDAMPAHLLAWHGPADIHERGVTVADNGQFTYAERPASGRLLTEASRLQTSESALQENTDGAFTSEINLAAMAWTAAWGELLQQGTLLLLDYGFPRHEFYHPQRRTGTLMCHYRHQAHADPFYLPGLQDITTHVDFTAIAEAGHGAGLDVLGYTTQSQFLFNCGLLDQLAALGPTDGADEAAQIAYYRAAAAVQKLVSPAEMGELFKVIALTRGIGTPLLGFSRGDRTHTL